MSALPKPALASEGRSDGPAALVIAPGDPDGLGPVVVAEAAHAFAASGVKLRWIVAYPPQLFSACLPTSLRDVWEALAASAALEWCPPPDAERYTHARLAREVGLSGRLQRECLSASAALCAARALPLVTGPVSKAACSVDAEPFPGQTEWLAACCGLAPDAVSMLFIGARLRLGLVTTHLALRDVPNSVSAPRIERTAKHLDEALLHLGFGREQPMVLAGLNPHAGEGGLLGVEERDVFGPCVEAWNAQPGCRTMVGPLGAETALRLAFAGTYAGAVTPYHDPATIALKLLEWKQAVNVTWGLPFIRTSVDHGVGYDARRSGAWSAEGMMKALDLARKLSASPARPA